MSRDKLILVVPFFCLLLALAGCQAKESSAEKVETPLVTPQVVRQVQKLVSVETVRPRTVRDVAILPGVARTWQSVKVAAGAGGRLEWLGPEEGQWVKKGQLLARINVSALKATLDQAKAAANLAETTYQRLQKLNEKGIATASELDQAASARTQTAKAARAIEAQYQEGFVHAPIGGVVNRVYMDAGEFVGMGTPLMDIEDISRIKVEVSVPESDVRYLSKGQKALLRFDAYPERHETGEIEFISYTADPATMTFRTLVAIGNEKGDIRAGMVARVALLKREIEEAISVPLSAVVDKSGERLVFVVENGVAHARPIEVGIIEMARVQVLSGLELGDQLIVTGQNGLEEGERVRVQ